MNLFVIKNDVLAQVTFVYFFFKYFALNYLPQYLQTFLSALPLSYELGYGCVEVFLYINYVAVLKYAINHIQQCNPELPRV